MSLIRQSRRDPRDFLFSFSRQALAQEKGEQLILKQGIRRKQPICAVSATFL